MTFPFTVDDFSVEGKNSAQIQGVLDTINQVAIYNEENAKVSVVEYQQGELINGINIVVHPNATIRQHYNNLFSLGKVLVKVSIEGALPFLQDRDNNGAWISDYNAVSESIRLKFVEKQTHDRISRQIFDTLIP